MTGNATNAVWILDDDRSIRWVLEKSLGKHGLDTRCFEKAEDLLCRLAGESPAAIISDIRMPGINGLELLSVIQQQHPELPIIIMTAHADLESAVASYSRGAFEYLPKPFDVDEAVAMTQRALAHGRATSAASDTGLRTHSGQLIGEAPAMQEVFRAIGRLSSSNISVLITGASGTGKELVARALHNHSPRKGRPFVPLNLAAIPRELIESELFGHEKGAFSGATQQRTGHFGQADGGTLLLDEIGDMPTDTQTRLLRVLSDGEFYRVGGHTPIRVDVRIIAATHQNLEALVAQHRFREDLFHRLNVIRIHIPSLAERREDIPRLTEHFLQRAAEELAVASKILRPETARYLCTLPWPGNVRQLENFCRWITVMGASREVLLSDLPAEFAAPSTNTTNTTNTDSADSWTGHLQKWAEQQLASGNSAILHQAGPMLERALIDTVLKHTSGRRQQAAALLGWGRNTLTRKIRQLGTAYDKTAEPAPEQD